MVLLFQSTLCACFIKMNILLKSLVKGTAQTAERAEQIYKWEGGGGILVVSSSPIPQQIELNRGAAQRAPYKLFGCFMQSGTSQRGC
jgi:hypothetical protein